MRISTRFMTTVLLAVAMMAGSAGAVNVLWVDNQTPHSSWLAFFESSDYSFTLYDTSTYSTSLANQESIDYVNSFDVIVISGSNPAHDAYRAHGAIWQQQPTPIINLNGYLVHGQYTGGNRPWTWYQTNATGINRSIGALDVLDASDPIWTGIDLVQGPPIQTPNLTSGTVHFTRPGTAVRDGVKILAVNPANAGEHAIMYAPKGTVIGYQNTTIGAAQYFIAAFQGQNAEALKLNAAGQQVFLNAITTLADAWEVTPTGTVIMLK